MNITTKQGTQGLLAVDSKGQKATLTVNGVDYLISFIRNNKVVIKSDLFLNDTDLKMVRQEMSKFIKVVETGKKGRK